MRSNQEFLNHIIKYSACYQDQVSSIVLIDFASRDLNLENRDNLAECWREGIEMYINSEDRLKESKQAPKKKQITYDAAVSRLLEANKHIDETAAKILLERGLDFKDGELEYTRDLRLITGVSKIR